MKEFFGIAAMFVCGIILLLGLTWVFAGNDFFLYKYFAPKQAAVQREVFENTKSYKQGMTQELENFKTEYLKGTDEQKASIKSIVLHRVSDYDVSTLPSYLQEFIEQLRNQTNF